MKILQINKYHYVKGGVDSVFFNTIRLLKAHGHTIIPFSIHHRQNVDSEFSDYFVQAPEIREQSLLKKITNIPKFFYNRDAARKLEKLILAEKPDIAHLHNIFNGISLSILPVLKKHGIPVVITMHDTRFICPSSRFQLRKGLCDNCKKRFYLNCALHKCYQNNLFYSMMTCMEMIHKEYLFKYDTYIDRYIFVSHRYHEFHGKIHDYFKTKGLVLYNFLSDIQTITPTSEKGDYWFYYGRLTEEKGIRTLVNVMKQFPDIQLKIAGTGPLTDSLKQTAGSNVEFLGFISGNALYEKIKKSAFVIVPSECWENNPLTVIESFACGKPVIGSSLGGIPEIIEDGKTGFVFEAFNVSSLIDTLNTALQIPADRYESMSANARDFAEKHFDASEHYNHLMNIYNKTIQEYDNF